MIKALLFLVVIVLCLSVLSQAGRARASCGDGSTVAASSSSPSSSVRSRTNASCDALDQAACKSTAGCTWCVSAAVPSSCFSDEDAAKLPAAVFTCSKKKGDEQQQPVMSVA